MASGEAELGGILTAIGGADGLTKAVDMLYERVLADDFLSAYFAGTDLDHIKRHQAIMMTALFGAPAGAPLPSVRKPHQGLQVTDEAFDNFIDLFAGVLTELGASPADTAAVAARLGKFRPQVIDSFVPNPAYNTIKSSN